MNATLPATIDVNPKGNDPKASIIWLHGLGADGADFVPITSQLGLKENQQVRFVFPHAPIRPITINNGMQMRAWYDIAELSIDFKEDNLGIEESAHLINLLIEREQSFGIPSDKILLAGFSQGGAMSLFAGLRYKQSLAGIIALSSYMPLAQRLSQEVHPNNKSIPIFMAHGLYDPVVPLMLGEMCHQQLEGLGFNIDWHTYPMPHTVIPQEIQDIGRFLAKVLTS